jgi:LacI family transcriptional regulator
VKALSSARPAVTIHDVAERAGVSIATVSRVVRGTARVAEPTRARVREAVRELGFVPSRPAQSLAEGRHSANGIVLPDLCGPYYGEVLLGYEEAAGELGHPVLIRSTRGRNDIRGLVLDLAARVDGLVILGYSVPDEVVREVVAGGTPTVLLARERVDRLDTVRAQNVGSARLLGEHLSEHGHRQFCFLGDPAVSPDVAERLCGLRAAIPEDVTVVPCALDEAAGEFAAEAALLAGERPDVLVCANDEVALGALFAARRLGLSVPRDIGITGWDDVMAARHVEPGLTTVRQPMRELGLHAALALHKRLRGDWSSPHNEVLPSRLVIRESCGCH